MSEKFRLDRKIGFQNTLYTKCINVIIDSIGPSIILRSIGYCIDPDMEILLALNCIIIFLPINLNMCFGCSKELSH